MHFSNYVHLRFSFIDQVIHYACPSLLESCFLFWQELLIALCFIHLLFFVLCTFFTLRILHTILLSLSKHLIQRDISFPLMLPLLELFVSLFLEYILSEISLVVFLHYIMILTVKSHFFYFLDLWPCSGEVHLSNNSWSWVKPEINFRAFMFLVIF